MKNLLVAFLISLLWYVPAQAQTDQVCVTSPSQTPNYNQLCISASSSGGSIGVTNFGAATGGLNLSNNSYLINNVTDINLITNQATASGTTLHFASVPATLVGASLVYVFDVTTPSAIPAVTVVESITPTTVVLSQSVTSVGSGDTISFGVQPTVTFVDRGIASSQASWNLSFEITDTAGNPVVVTEIACGSDPNSGVGYNNTVAAWVGDCDFIANGYGPPQTTNNTTANGNATLHFAATPAWIIAGMGVSNLTHSTTIPPGTLVLSKTPTTVVMTANAAGAGVSNGDSIQFFGIVARYSLVGPVGTEGGGLVPDSDAAYVLGWTTQRWADVQSVQVSAATKYNLNGSMFVEALGNYTYILDQSSNPVIQIGNNSDVSLYFLRSPLPDPDGTLALGESLLRWANIYSVSGNFSGGITASGLPTSAGSGGLYVCVDTAGVLYKKSSCP